MGAGSGDEADDVLAQRRGYMHFSYCVDEGAPAALPCIRAGPQLLRPAGAAQDDRALLGGQVITGFQQAGQQLRFGGEGTK